MLVGKQPNARCHRAEGIRVTSLQEITSLDATLRPHILPIYRREPTSHSRAGPFSVTLSTAAAESSHSTQLRHFEVKAEDTERESRVVWRRNVMIAKETAFYGNLSRQDEQVDALRNGRNGSGGPDGAGALGRVPVAAVGERVGSGEDRL